MESNKNTGQKKLEYVYDNKNTHLALIWLIVLILVSSQEGIKINFEFYLFFIFILFVIMVGLYFSNRRKLKINTNTKNKGIKISGIIESIVPPDFIITSYGTRRGTIFIKTKNTKSYSIGMIRVNRAYRLIYHYLAEKRRRRREIKCEGEMDPDMLFDMDITIDLYINGSTVYADLNSVDIAPIEKRYNYFIKNKNNY